MHRILAVLLGLMVAVDAHALDPYMWGVGPRVGTMVIPGRYPLRYPQAIRESEDTSLQRVRHDLTVGGEAVYYINTFTRMLASGGFGFGQNYFDAHFLVKWNYVMQTGAMDFLLGAGTGFGSHHFGGEDPEQLNIPYFPVRAEGSALIRDNVRGYQATIYGQWAIPSNHYYTDPAGNAVDVSSGTNITVGIEIAVFFGDFTPPRPRGD